MCIPQACRILASRDDLDVTSHADEDVIRINVLKAQINTYFEIINNNFSLA